MAFQHPLYATHYRAGEITYQQISLLQYKITVITYTDQTKQADQFTGSIYIDYGDGQNEIIPRTNGNGTILNVGTTNFPVKQNKYETVHVYRGASIYRISVSDPNRVAGIVNAPGQSTDKFSFYVETKLVISSSLGYNQSPILSVPPIDIGCLNQIYTHNPGAHDPDGDSLFYELRPPNIESGVPMPGFILPYASSYIHLDSIHGQLVWDRPIVSGIYNIVIRIYEFRHGKSIGYVDRDMQIYIVGSCNNRPPTLSQVSDDCITQGVAYSKILTASDPDAGTKVSVYGYGGPFMQVESPASMFPTAPFGNVPLNFNFLWTPACPSVRYRPYQANFKVSDNENSPLTTLGYLSVKVIAQSLKNFSITAKPTGFELDWAPDTCKRAIYYAIYRRLDSSHWNPSKCETGVPAYTGFKLLDTLSGNVRHHYFDDDNGKGLSPMIRYCYRVIAVYPPQSENGNYILGEVSESYAGSEVCDVLIRTAPVIIKTSVSTTSQKNGSIFIKWIKPDKLDTIQYPGPYRYILYGADSLGNFNRIIGHIDYTNFASLSDVLVLDTLINTENYSFTFKVELWTSPSSVLQKTEESVPAQSIFLSLYNSDHSIRLQWNEKVPWINHRYDIFRKDPGSSQFKWIAGTSNQNYLDDKLTNGQSYCYLVQSHGTFTVSVYPDSIENYSQIACGIPIDTVPPCQPPFLVVPPCAAFEPIPTVNVTWNVSPSCGTDIKEFRIYFSKNNQDSLRWIGTVASPSNLFNDERDDLKYSIAGCYAVSAVDTNGNESVKNKKICIDNCPEYYLPNVFTPDNLDSLNTVFKPFPYRYVDHIGLTIYNRWGQIVFESNDPAIQWNGKDKDTQKDVSSGVYYYVCDVYERYLSGIKKRNLRGTITLIRE